MASKLRGVVELGYLLRRRYHESRDEHSCAGSDQRVGVAHQSLGKGS
jgi:hypothetical protein